MNVQHWLQIKPWIQLSLKMIFTFGFLVLSKSETVVHGYRTCLEMKCCYFWVYKVYGYAYYVRGTKFLSGALNLIGNAAAFAWVKKSTRAILQWVSETNVGKSTRLVGNKRALRFSCIKRVQNGKPEFFIMSIVVWKQP